MPLGQQSKLYKTLQHTGSHDNLLQSMAHIPCLFTYNIGIIHEIYPLIIISLNHKNDRL
jgi:hypothetical protein